MNYYKFNIGDFAVMAEGLDEEGIGILVRLINRFAFTEKPVKTQWVFLGFREEKQKKALAILESLWEKAGEDGWVYPPLVEQVATYTENAAKNRANGKKGGRPKKTRSVFDETQTEPSGFLSESQTKPNEKATINHKPLTNKEESNKESDLFDEEAPKYSRAPKRDLVKPDDVSQEVFEEWVAFKDGFKVKCSQRMVDFIAREAEKAGISTEEAMLTAMEHGWQSFQASYVAGRPRATAPAAEPAPIDYHKGFNPDGTF